MPLTLKSLRAGWGPVGFDFEVKPRDRDVLNPLFEVLRDKRALLLPASRRAAQMPYVTESIKSIRTELTNTLRSLDPDSYARPWVETLRAACREYLSQAESPGFADAEPSDLEPALAQLRTGFYVVAQHAGAYYRIRAARELADEMAANDAAHSDADREAFSQASSVVAELPRQFKDVFESETARDKAAWLLHLERAAATSPTAVKLGTGSHFESADKLSRLGALKEVRRGRHHAWYEKTDQGRLLLSELRP